MTHTAWIVVIVVAVLIALAVWKHLRGIMDATRVTERQQDELRELRQGVTGGLSESDEAYEARLRTLSHARWPDYEQQLKDWTGNDPVPYLARMLCPDCQETYRTDRPLEEVMELHKKKCQGAKSV